ncbi:MAG: 3-methyl-2-oxobutanoate hydroxymethyltransferase [Phycisphaeraceae bacterium]|nr:3-methyl-2-oxobutanoate hydroxymethyltransferase [Phycisphaeraceae bacterium]
MNPPIDTNPTTPKRITLSTIRRMARSGEKIAMLTCYDATTARWLARAGIPALLVGDSAAQMIFGYENTTQVSLSQMLMLTAAVRRGAPDCFIMGDMPFMSYQADDAEAIHNAGRFLSDANADIVKLEVGPPFIDLMRKLTRAGIPTCAHIGWRPQRTQQVGVPVVAGRTPASVDQLVELALQLEDAGCAMLLLEQSTAETAQRIIERVHIPLIGCGAGPACHGHVLILQDLLGLTDHHPSFAEPITDGAQWLTTAATQWLNMVRTGQYLKDNHPYHMHPAAETPAP